VERSFDGRSSWSRTATGEDARRELFPGSVSNAGSSRRRVQRRRSGPRCAVPYVESLLQLYDTRLPSGGYDRRVPIHPGLVGRGKFEAMSDDTTRGGGGRSGRRTADVRRMPA